MTDNYLKHELDARLQSDPAIFSWLDSGSLDGIWYWDLEAPDQEWMSPRFKAVFGYADHEIPNTSAWWQENIHPDDLPVAIQNAQRHFEDPDHPYDQVVRYRHKLGHTVWVRCRGLAIRNADGKPIRMLGAHTDVTPLKEAERELRTANAALEAKVELLDQFAAIASHDLRAPLRAIGQVAEWLHEDLSEQLNEEQRELFGLLLGRRARLQSMLESLRDFVRLSDRAGDAHDTVDVDELIASSLEELAQAARSPRCRRCDLVRSSARRCGHSPDRWASGCRRRWQRFLGRLPQRARRRRTRGTDVDRHGEVSPRAKAKRSAKSEILHRLDGDFELLQLSGGNLRASRWLSGRSSRCPPPGGRRSATLASGAAW